MEEERERERLRAKRRIPFPLLLFKHMGRGCGPVEEIYVPLFPLPARVPFGRLLQLTKGEKVRRSHFTASLAQFSRSTS